MKKDKTTVSLSTIFDVEVRQLSHGKELPNFSPSASQPLPVVFAEEMRQFAYCPRVIYWRRIAGIKGVPTYLMEEGNTYHQQRKSYTHTRKGDLIVHRNRYFWDADHRVGAVIDACREQNDGIYIVEFKRFHHGTSTYHSHLIQAIFGGMIASNILELPLLGIEIQYYPGITKTFHVNQKDQRLVIEILDKLRNMLVNQILPDPTPHLNKCRVCEYQKVCRRDL